MSETGVAKFSCEHHARELPEFPGLGELNDCRRQLRELGWIGLDEFGIGFGNVSVRDAETRRFYITGSGTGGLAELTPANYALVVAHDLERNWLRCEGASVASSESLTHAAVYDAVPAVRAVIHCHAAELWARLLHVEPTTGRAAEYGTPEMAREVERLCRGADVLRPQVFVMAGHENGLLAFGATAAEALRALLARRSG